jgi:DNA-binding transcriptional MerR regulator
LDGKTLDFPVHTCENTSVLEFRERTMAVTAIEPISEMRSSKKRRQVFSTGEMAAMLNVSLDEVDYWVRSKLIVPSIREAAGHGTRRLFGILDLKQAFLIQRLRKADWKPRQIAKAFSAVAPAMQDPDLLHTPLLIHEGNAFLILCRSKGQELILLDAASPGQYVMVIALDALEEEMRKSLARSR